MKPGSLASRLRGALPAQPVGTALLARGVTFWFLIRAALALLGVAGSGGMAVVDPGSTLPHAVFLSPAAAAAVIPVAGALMMLDVARRGEPTLLANLGISRATVVAMAAVPAAVFELLLGGVALLSGVTLA